MVQRRNIVPKLAENVIGYIKSVDEKAKELYFDQWLNHFTCAKTKKDFWKLLSLDGKYPPTLNKFYKNVRGFNREQILEEIGNYFTYENLKRVFQICEIEPDYTAMGLNDRDIAKFYPTHKLKQLVDSLKLKAELIPMKSWCRNLRKRVRPSQWDKIRHKSYADAGYRCGICGAEEKLECHEIWEYDEENKIQKLSGFIALCRPCHQIKHIGRTRILVVEIDLDFNLVIEHFMKVNNCERLIFTLHEEYVFEEWRQRSKFEWTVDLGQYEDLVKLPVKT